MFNDCSDPFVLKSYIDQSAFVGESGVVFAVKLYPAGATTNSQDGVTDLFGKCMPVLEEMAKQHMPLLVSLTT